MDVEKCHKSLTDGNILRSHSATLPLSCPFWWKTQRNYVKTVLWREMPSRDNFDAKLAVQKSAVHIIRDLTTPDQRKLFNNAKRLQLKVARYEHHISNYNY